MTLSPGWRKLALTVHVTASVGWFGAVASFLVLAVVGMTAADPDRVRAAYIGMEIIGWYAIVPSSFASLVSGLVQGLGTKWGVFRHYWVLVKLVINVLATIVLLAHMSAVSAVGDAAMRGPLADGDLRGLRVQLVGDAAAALAVLLVAIVLSIYKPRGVTRYGWRKARVEAG